MLPSPLFFAPARYVPLVHMDEACVRSIRKWCDIAGIDCKASGAWVERRVGWMETPEMTLTAQPGYVGDVLIGVPSRVVKHGEKEIARYVLQVMAYSELFDGVVRESVRGVTWARHIG